MILVAIFRIIQIWNRMIPTYRMLIFARICYKRSSDFISYDGIIDNSTWLTFIKRPLKLCQSYPWNELLLSSFFQGQIWVLNNRIISQSHLKSHLYNYKCYGVTFWILINKTFVNTINSNKRSHKLFRLETANTILQRMKTAKYKRV